MTDQCCSNIHCSIDDQIIQWKEVLGDPAASTPLNNFVDLKIANIEGDLEKLIDEKFEELAGTIDDKVQEALKDVELNIDPYKIVYHDTTVGDALDNLNKKSFVCTIGKKGPYEKGQNFPTFVLTWYCSETPKTLIVERLGTKERYELDPATRTFTFENVSGDDTFRVSGVTVQGETFDVTQDIVFKHRWYRGSHGFTDPSNNVIINWASNLVDKDTDFGTSIFNCEPGQYIYFAFPEDLHLTYDFFANGLKDTNWSFTVKDVTNQYGYVHKYVIYRTNNLLHGKNIYVEVKSHDWY